MALATGTIFQVQASATTGNTGGAGFNTANANFPTDLAATSATTASPVVTSATYNFVAGDVGAWVYIKSGTNWTPGWYQISSVAANAATLTAGVGTVVLTISTMGVVTLNTIAGCATVSSPTSGTYGVDYSQQDGANSTITDAASLASSTNLTSVTAPWTPVSVGNFFHLTTTGTGGFGVTGWYEIVSYTNTSTVVTDRTTNNGTALVAGTGLTGGAGRLNGLEDAFHEMIPAGSLIFIKNGTYVLSAAIAVASTNSTGLNPSYFIGYNSIRGDTCIGSNKPVFTCAGNTWVAGQHQNYKNISFTSTVTAGITVGTNAIMQNCKFMNSSTTAGRSSVTMNVGGSMILDCECVSQNGSACTNSSSSGLISFCYFHDSVTGLNTTISATIAYGNIFEACSTDAFNGSNASGKYTLTNNTFYGREAKMGNGINLSVSLPLCRIVSNIIYGFTNGITSNTQNDSNIGIDNDYFNNTTDVTNFLKSPDALALNPSFSGATQLTGTTATTSGSTLTDSGADFSTVTDNVDYLRVTAGTGTTLGGYLITSHTGTTLTVNNVLSTGASADKVYFVTTGHNFSVGNASLKGAGYPTFANSGSETTGFPTVGAVQAAATGTSIFVMAD